ncbi:MAG: protein phosphatase [Cryobacterium sp.]|nr:protein phosphatase [Cryobacterium sp.]
MPHSFEEALDALKEAHDRAEFERVEIACNGGTGRTGTAIAILARMAGVPGSEASRWTRTHYRRHAVETPWQRRFVTSADLAR